MTSQEQDVDIRVIRIHTGNDPGNFISLDEATGKQIVVSRDWERLGGGPLKSGQLILARCVDRERCIVAFPIMSGPYPAMERNLTELAKRLEQESLNLAVRWEQCQQLLNERLELEGQRERLAEERRQFEHRWAEDTARLDQRRDELQRLDATLQQLKHELSEHSLAKKHAELVAAFAALEEDRITLLEAAEDIKRRVIVTTGNRALFDELVPQSLRTKVPKRTASDSRLPLSGLASQPSAA